PDRSAPSRYGDVATLFSPDATLMPVEEWAVDLEYRKGARGTRVVKQALEGLLPGARFSGIDRETRTLRFDTDDGTVPLQQLSDGYQSVAAFTGDLLFRITQTFNDYVRPLSTRGLLLVDEIELHLHPRVQRGLRAFLQARFPHFQVLATTHSALTAQQAGEGELWVLQRDEKRVPVVSRYAASPEKLQVQHLLLSDAFGLESLSSPKVEEYKRLDARKRDKGLPAGEQRRLTALSKELSPSAADEPDADLRELKALVARVDAALAKGNG
ncbi:MAG: ATP-binding protein, partial [Myxococcaceae bacterium]|nr:ATP-binding protein [Myxococcaceae bacterium]